MKLTKQDVLEIRNMISFKRKKKKSILVDTTILHPAQKAP